MMSEFSSFRPLRVLFECTLAQSASAPFHTPRVDESRVIVFRAWSMAYGKSRSCNARTLPAQYSTALLAGCRNFTSKGQENGPAGSPIV